MANWYYTGPTFTGGVDENRIYGGTPSPLWRYVNAGTSTYTKTVTKTSGVYAAYVKATLTQIDGADVVYYGGHETLIDGDEKTLIEASGVGGAFAAA